MKITDTKCKFDGITFEVHVFVEDEGMLFQGQAKNPNPNEAAHAALSDAIKSIASGLHKNLKLSVNIDF